LILGGYIERGGRGRRDSTEQREETAVKKDLESQVQEDANKKEMRHGMAGEGRREQHSQNVNRSLNNSSSSFFTNRP
jgi:hypothetical protein